MHRIFAMLSAVNLNDPCFDSSIRMYSLFFSFKTETKAYISVPQYYEKDQNTMNITEETEEK